jgi:hypothetical protein
LARSFFFVSFANLSFFRKADNCLLFSSQVYLSSNRATMLGLPVVRCLAKPG